MEKEQKERLLGFSMERLCDLIKKYENCNPATLTVLDQRYQQETMIRVVSNINAIEGLKHDDLEYLSITFGDPAGMTVCLHKAWPVNLDDLAFPDLQARREPYRDARMEFRSRGFNI